MMKIDIPGFGVLRLRHLALDYNGTLAADGKLLRGIKPRLAALGDTLQIHVLTADTFGRAAAALRGVDCRLTVLEERRQDRAKAAYVRRLGASATVAIGNGRNDSMMLRAAALGIAVLQVEGACARTLVAADVVVKSVHDGLDLLLAPLRLIATLRR